MNNQTVPELISELSDAVTLVIIDALKDWFENSPEKTADKLFAEIEALSAVRLAMCESVGVSVETLEEIMKRELEGYRNRRNKP